MPQPVSARRTRPLLLLLLLLLGCAPGRPGLISDVSASPPEPSPDLREVSNRLDVHYRLGAPAVVTARIQAPDGRAWVVYEETPRPRAGDYVLSLDGSVPGPGPDERRVLPEGDYQVVLDAEAGGSRQEAIVPLPIRDPDTAAPEIQELTLQPDRITPSFDVLAGATRVSYRLTKAARVSAFADRLRSDGSRERVWMGEEVEAEAGERSLEWDGRVNSAPVSDGRYEFGIRARDRAGNVAEARRPFSVDGSGVQDARITWAHIGPRQIVRGGRVCADVTVRNTGATALPTQGPDPSYVYDSLDTYASIEGHRHVEQAGAWRVGLGWARTPNISATDYPYRWGLGRELGPGEEATIHGCVEVHNQEPRMVFFAALIQERVYTHDRGAGLVPVSVSL